MDHEQQKKRAGRPPLPAGQRKERVSVRLPPSLLVRLRAEESPSQTIAAALQNHYTANETGDV